MDSSTPPEAKPLPDPPSDGVTALSYLPNEENLSHLVSTSWDGSVRIHDTNAASSSSSAAAAGGGGAAAGAAVLSHMMESGPLLSLATPSGFDAVVTGGLDGSIRMLDIPSTTPTVIGHHKAAASNSDGKVGCSCLASFHREDGTEETNSNLLASAGWSRQFHLWDIRQSSAVATLDLPGKAYDIDVHAKTNRIVVVTSGRRTCFIDIRKSLTTAATAELVLERESSLKFQTRCVRFFPDGNGIALGSIEGRVGVEFLEELGVPATMKKYAFKCHRVNDTVYPVNCIEFHPRFLGTFATGGCDGSVVLWDGMHKKKLTTFPSFPTSISAMAFNHNGSEMAIASSYTYEEGDRAHPKDEIYIRALLDSECMPKPK